MASSDTPCHCEEKQQVLPHDSDLNPFNPHLHDTVVPGAFDICTSALETNTSPKIGHDNLHCVNPTGNMKSMPFRLVQKRMVKMST